jgi:hypothetical protein
MSKQTVSVYKALYQGVGKSFKAAARDARSDLKEQQGSDKETISRV